TLVHDLQSEYPKIYENISENLASVAKSINVKQHVVNVTNERRVQVPTSSSIEIHQHSPTQTTYAVNLHEVFPMDFFVPEVSSKQQTQESENGETISAIHTQMKFHDHPDSTRRFRPEFLQIYAQPIVSDAFTQWSGSTPRECEEADAEAMAASRFLRENWIPSFVKKLDNLKIRPIDSRTLTIEMHRAGINMRYLGIKYKNLLELIFFLTIF
ncbi:hypothetical protein HK096_002074, partial [Nowakowskiella sp. JEL0078]